MAVTVSCVHLTCGVPFVLPDHVYTQARDNPGRTFYCPNGHAQYCSESEVDRLKKRVADLEARCERELAVGAAWRMEVDRYKRRIWALKGAITRLQKRRH